MVYNSKDWKLRYFAPGRPQGTSNTIRLFNINNARTKHSSLYKKEELETIIDRDFDKLSIKHFSNMISPQDGWSNNCCFLPDENISDYEIILVLEEEKRYKTREDTGRWIKVALKVKTTGDYIIRSIHSRLYDNIINKKSYKKSQMDEWFIDDSTTAADYIFWKELKLKLSYYR